MSDLTPNLIFPALDARDRERREVSPSQVMGRQAREARRVFTAKLREEAIAIERPPVGKFTLTNLDDAVCRWPVNDGAPYLFCGAATACAPYCTDHTADAKWRPGESRKPFSFKLRDLSAR